jgi:hypothetical protein
MLFVMVLLNQVTLAIPSSALTSYAGSLVKVSHELCIEAKTPSCVTNPEINIPLQIVTGAFEKAAVTAPTPVATAYPEGWSTANVTTIPLVQAVGPVSYGGNEKNSTAVPSAPPMPTSTGYTFKKLLEELSSCVSVTSKLEELLIDPQWKSILSRITPKEFDAVLKKVMQDFDKIDVANLLCPQIQNFTCAYAASILGSVSNFLRIQLVQAMLPNIVDLDANKSVLLSRLSEWERVCTERDFKSALAGRGGGPASCVVNQGQKTSQEEVAEEDEA